VGPDVAAELKEAWAELAGSGDGDVGFRLIVRRVKETVNSVGKQIPGLPRFPYNPLFVHPDDLAELGVGGGDDVLIESEHGKIHGMVEPDATAIASRVFSDDGAALL
jgi:anaerobic selenocysteine-containing dehydrogenase